MPIFTVSEKQKQVIQEHLKNLGTSNKFPKSMVQIQDLSQYYDMQKVFDDTNFPDEHYLMEQMERGTQNNFPEVMSGEQHSLIMLPDNVFHYGKGRDQAIIHIELILQRIKQIENQIDMDTQNNPKLSSSAEEQKGEINKLELDHMKNLADGLLTEQAEGDIYLRFQELLHDELGFMIHGYLPETYLKAITTRAKDQRKTLIQKAKDSNYTVDDFAIFTKLESKLQEVLGLTKVVVDEADLILNNIEKL